MDSNTDPALALGDIDRGRRIKCAHRGVFSDGHILKCTTHARLAPI